MTAVEVVAVEEERMSEAQREKERNEFVKKMEDERQRRVEEIERARLEERERLVLAAVKSPLPKPTIENPQVPPASDSDKVSSDVEGLLSHIRYSLTALEAQIAQQTSAPCSLWVKSLMPG